MQYSAAVRPDDIGKAFSRTADSGATGAIVVYDPTLYLHHMAALNVHAAAFASAATIAVHADQRAAYRVVSVRASALHAHGLNRRVS